MTKKLLLIVFLALLIVTPVVVALMPAQPYANLTAVAYRGRYQNLNRHHVVAGRHKHDE